jgi:ParB/RepB/Spo0J family partition protein
MAKRRRLTPAQSDYLTAPAPLEVKAWIGAGAGLAPPPIAPPPIAQVAAEASATSALQEVSEALASARAEGRLLLHLPLEVIEADYLVRDRLAMDPEEMTALVESLRARGQRTPIEVTEIAPGRYGLISGWRRLRALESLREETGEARFARVLAILRRPETSGAAYVAMVEENEIRHGLSYYERARIAARAVGQGVFASEKEALRQLFSTASRAKRSKIGSFLEVHRRLDGLLRFPAALPERLGLHLTRVLETDPARTAALIRALELRPADSAAQELALIAGLTGPAGDGDAGENSVDSAGSETVFPSTSVPAAPAPPRARSATPPATPTAAPDQKELRPGVILTVTGGWLHPILTLSGPNVGPDLRERLEDWLRG